MDSDESKELKYEGLSAIIIDGHEQMNARMTDLKKDMREGFSRLEAYNQKQNGNQAAAMKEIAALKEESEKRKVTCMVAVENMQKVTKYTRIMKWIDKHPKMSVFLLFLAFFVTEVVVLYIVERGLIDKFFGIIIK